MGKVDPLRDYFEITITKKAIEKEKPLLAICRGIQVLNVAAGGTLIQDIYTQIKDPIKHVWYSASGGDAPPNYPTHKIKIKKDSKLYELFKKETLRVNSFHHQAVKDVGDKLTPTAWAEDGIIEALEYVGKRFIMGIQWHPERMLESEMIKLFQALIKDAATK